MTKNFRVLADVEYTVGYSKVRRRIAAGTVVGADFIKNPDTAHILKPHQLAATADAIGPPERGWLPPATNDSSQTKLDLPPKKSAKKTPASLVVVDEPLFDDLPPDAGDGDGV